MQRMAADHVSPRPHGATTAGLQPPGLPRWHGMRAGPVACTQGRRARLAGGAAHAEDAHGITRTGPPGGLPGGGRLVTPHVLQGLHGPLHAGAALPHGLHLQPDEGA